MDTRQLQRKKGNAIHHLSVHHLGGVPRHQDCPQPAPGEPNVQQDQDAGVLAYVVSAMTGSDVCLLPEIYDGCPVTSTGVYPNVVAAVGYRNTTPAGDSTPLPSGTVPAVPF